MINLPDEFSARMRALLADTYPEFVESLQQPAPVSIRLNPAKSVQISSDSTVPWSDRGRYLKARPSFTMDPLFHAGTYYVQEASSMFLEQALRQSADLTGTIRVLDLSAAPGGKTTHILSLISPDSLLISNEVIRSRASVLSENVIKWGYPNCIVTNNDPADFKTLSNVFDVVVVDAPCSGEGLFRKDPEAILEWSQQNVELCSSRQRRIISDIWNSLKENGVLIYSTCTYNALENEDNLQWVSRQFDAEWISLDVDPAWGIEKVEGKNIFGYRFYPHRVKGEGFFISVIRKKSGTTEFKRARRQLTDVPGKSEGAIREFVKPRTAVSFFKHEDIVFYLPEAQRELAELVRENLRIVHAGTRVATFKHDKLVPEHSVALSIELNQEHFNQLPVDREDAIRFLRRENMLTGLPNERGYYLITFENTPLGWINNLGNRYNSLYPVEWRIRKS